MCLYSTKANLQSKNVLTRGKLRDLIEVDNHTISTGRREIKLGNKTPKFMINPQNISNFVELKSKEYNFREPSVRTVCSKTRSPGNILPVDEEIDLQLNPLFFKKESKGKCFSFYHFNMIESTVMVK